MGDSYAGAGGMVLLLWALFLQIAKSKTTAWQAILDELRGLRAIRWKRPRLYFFVAVILLFLLFVFSPHTSS